MGQHPRDIVISMWGSLLLPFIGRSQCYYLPILNKENLSYSYLLQKPAHLTILE